VRLGNAGTFSVRHDREERVSGGAAGIAGVTRITSAQWGRDSKRWGMAAEYQGRATEDSAAVPERSDLGAARVWRRFGKRLTTRLEQQSTLSGAKNDQTTVGLQYQMLERLALEASATHGTLGRSARGGATLTVGGGQVYVREQAADQGSGTTRTTVLGGAVPLGPTSRVYSEYQWEGIGPEAQRTSLVGLEQGWRPGQGMELSVTAEHAGAGQQSPGTRRTSLSGILRMAHPSGIEGSTQEEVRIENGAHERVQFVTLNRLSVRLKAGLTALAQYRSGVTRDRTLDRDEARFVEGGLGLAFRPLNDRVHLLVRTSRLSDQRVPAAGVPNPVRNPMDVSAIEGSVELVPGLDWTAKLANRAYRSDASSLPSPGTDLVLAVNRLDWRFYGPFGTGAEHRVQALRETENKKSGWLNEVHWEAAQHMRIGAGYSFTNVSDNEFAGDAQSVRGWFFRLQGKY